MLEFDIATDVQRLYTDVAIIVKGYREAKPDRNTRNLTRSLANEEILYSQFLLRLSLLSSLEKSGGDNNNNNNNNHNLLQGVETKVGPERSESMRADLEHMESFLRSFKVEISNASRGTEVLVNLRRKATGSRINIPKPPLQKRVDELSNINKRLASYLADEQIRVPLLADSHAALDFTLRIPQHRDEPYGALRIIGVQHACACQEGDSTSVISDDYTKPSIDNDNVSITVVNESPFLQQTYKHTSISVYDMRSSKPAPRMVGATRQHDNRRMIDMLFKPAEVPGAAIGLHELLTKNAFKLDVMKAKELAFRLASAVLLLLSLRLPGDTLKWKNPKILIDVEKDVGSCDLYIIPRVRRDEDSSEEQLRTNAVISIISRDISLTLLGIRLCEIGFGYTLKEARQRDSSLPPELDKGESLIRDIRTARQLLAQGRIREEFGHKYEAVVSACVNQQYREVKTGEVKDLNVGDASFFEIATVLILMPLHREYRMISGCECDKVPFGRVRSQAGRTKAAGDETNRAQKVEVTIIPETQRTVKSRILGKKVAETSPVHVSKPSGLESAPAVVSRSPNEDLQRLREPSRKDNEVQPVDDSALRLKPTPPKPPLRRRDHDLDNSSEHSFEAITATTDSDSGSLSDGSDMVPPIAPDNPLLRFNKIFSVMLWREYSAWRSRGNTTNEATGTASRGGPSKKRQWNNSAKEEDDEGDEENERDAGAVHSATKKARLDKCTVTFACPFFKKDPLTHRHCCTYLLSRIRDVKQHLKRCHPMPIYCPRCMQVFRDEGARDSHVRDIDCPKRPFVKLEGISRAQKKELGKKAPPNQTVEDQWYLIWTILFPGVEKPPSPYIDRGLLHNVLGYQSYLTANGPRILQEVLARPGFAGYTATFTETDRLAFHQLVFGQAIEQLFNEWTTDGGRGTLQAGANRGATHHTMPGQDSVPGAPTMTGSSFSGLESPESSSMYATSYGQEDMSVDSYNNAIFGNLQIGDAGTGGSGTSRWTFPEPDELESMFPDSQMGQSSGY